MDSHRLLKNLDSKVKRIANEYVNSLPKVTIKDVPLLPTNILEWIRLHRPYVAGKARNFDLEPFWLQPYRDNHPDIMMVNGRQTYKTTFSTDIIGCASTSMSNIEIGYIVDTEVHRLAYSKQRLRRETYLENEDLKKFLDKDRVNVGEIGLIDGVTVYLMTDENEYNQAESRSFKLVITDETQYQDVQFLPKVLYTMSRTKGRIYKLGIGGEAGSEYHRMWKQTDQNHWFYHNENYRKDLVFNEIGDIINSKSELKQLLDGYWEPQKPENTMYRGYWMPQTIFPRIPMTIEEAIYKYKTKPEFSIEYQRKHFPRSIYTSHTLGEFYKAERRPITPEMVEACYDYSIQLLTPEQVRKIKGSQQNKIRVLAGIDWGSGPSASSTVVSVWIKWKETGRYQIAHVEKRPQEHQLDQVKYLAELLGVNGYDIDVGVGDLGYGQIQVKLMQDGGSDSKGNWFEGLGAYRFFGCRTYGDETKPRQEFVQEEDEHGTELGRIQIDKTTTIQKFVDFIDWYIPLPDKPDIKQTKLMIPMKIPYETDWLLNDFTAITRKDLEKDQDVKEVEDPRQKAKKEFNHPRDSVMSSIYCLVADEQEEGAFDVYPVKR